MDGAAPRVGSRRPAPVSHRHDGDPAHRFTPLVPTIPPLTPPRRTASFARRAPAPTGNGQSASTPPVLRQRRSAAFRACEQTVPCSWREFDPVLARMRNFGAAGERPDAPPQERQSATGRSILRRIRPTPPPDTSAVAAPGSARGPARPDLPNPAQDRRAISRLHDNPMTQSRCAVCRRTESGPSGTPPTAPPAATPAARAARHRPNYGFIGEILSARPRMAPVSSTVRPFATSPHCCRNRTCPQGDCSRQAPETEALFQI